MAVTAAELKVRFSTDGVGKTKADINSLGQTVDSVDGKSQGFLKTAAATTFGFLGGNLIMGGISQLKGLAGGFIMANASAETYRNQLEIAAGSTQKAGEIFTWLQKMAADTPFEFPELINAATQLESLGQSSQKWLPIIGDTAAATGKSVDQVTQAVLDAQTGEFERLKELGIRTKVEGDKVKFSFMKNGQEMVVEAENTQEGISNALMGIWSDKYTGAMDKLSSTFLGKLSTLKDNINLIAQGISKPLFDVAKQGLTFANSFIGNFTDMLGKGLPATAAFAYAARQALMDAFGPKVANALTPTIYAIADGMETLSGVFSAVAGVVKGVLGAAFSFLADHIDLVVGAIKGVIAAMAIIAGWGAITAIVAGLGAAFAALLSPLGLLILGAAALGMAWQKNLFGIQDKVKKVVDKTKPKLKELSDYFDQAFVHGSWTQRGNFIESGFNHLSNGIRSIGNSIPFLKGPMDWLGDAIQALPGLTADAGRQFKSFLDQGLNPVAAGFGTLGVGFAKLSDMFPQFSGFFAGMRDQMTGWMGVAQSVGNGIVDLFNGDLTGALQNFGDAASQVWDNVINGAQTLWTGIKEAASAIDWSALWDGAKDIAGDIVGGLGDLAGALWDWVSGAAASIDWGSVWSTAQDVASTVISKLGDLASALMTWVADAAGRVDWASIASSAVDIASTVVGKLGDLGSQLMTWVASAASRVDWGSIASGARDIAGDVIGRIGDLGSRLMTWVVEASSRIDWGSIASTARDITSSIVLKLGDLATALKNWITSSASAMDLSGIGATIAAKLTAIDYSEAGKGLADKIVSGLGTALTGISWADVGFAIGKMLQLLIAGNIALGEFATGFISELGSKLSNADWGDVGGAIKDAFKGFWNGITDGLDKPISQAKQKIINFVNEVIGWVNKAIAALNSVGANIKPIPLITFFNPDILADHALQGGKKAGDAAVAGVKAGVEKMQGVLTQAATASVNAAAQILNNMKTKVGTGGSGSTGTPQGGGGGNMPGGGGGTPGGMEPYSTNIGKDNPFRDRVVTTRFVAEDQTSPVTSIINAAIAAIPASKQSTLTQTGGEAVAAISAVVGAAVGFIPTNHMTAIQQAGGEVVSAVSTVARAAVNAIPTSHLTAILQAGGEGVTAVSNAAANAIRSIPTSHSTSISEAGAAGVASAANAAAAAINAIPSIKNVAISVTVSGISAAQAALAGVTGGKWTGGYTNTPLTWLAEKGRELVQTPMGEWFLAAQKSLFAVPLGSRVYSNPETERMMAGLMAVPGYATGGIVGGGSLPTLAPAGGRSVVNNVYVTQHNTIDASSIEQLMDVDRFFSNLDREAELAFGGSF